MNRHLSSEELDGVLSGQAREEATAHLSACVLCAGELAQLRNGFGDLRVATTAAAEHHRHFAATASARRVPRMAWALATIALFVSVATPLIVHRRAADVPGVVPVAVAISDEALLDSVRNDLASSVPESLQPLASTSPNATLTTNTTRKN